MVAPGTKVIPSAPACSIDRGWGEILFLHRVAIPLRTSISSLIEVNPLKVFFVNALVDAPVIWNWSFPLGRTVTTNQHSSPDTAQWLPRSPSFQPTTSQS